MMEITIKINGRMVSVEVSDEVAECYDQGRRKAENLSHEKRRHWDDREFDEYIAAAEGLLPYWHPPKYPETNPAHESKKSSKRVSYSFRKTAVAHFRKKNTARTKQAVPCTLPVHGTACAFPQHRVAQTVGALGLVGCL